MDNIFETALKKTLNDEATMTENGACAFATAGNPLLDINFAVSSLRSKTEAEIQKAFSDAFYFNPLLATKWLFMLRDVRGSGMGERRSFRICFSWLANARPALVKKLIPLTAFYGRWDDLLLSGFEGELWDTVVDYVDKQLEQDYKNMEANKPVSLLAKWMPSINTSSSKSVSLAKKLAKSLNLSEKQYRKTLSKLRAYLKVIEVDASSGNWSEIDYNTVPSMANLKYKDAFLKHDEVRRKRYLEDLKKPKSGAKINAAASFPCDIVHAYRKCSIGYYKCSYSEDAALEAMWKALPDYTKGLSTGSTICVADGSGSMTQQVSNTSMTALEVANSIAIYFAEKLTGPFKDKYITFSERPQYVDFTNAKTLAEKLSIACQHDECANTNIEAVFDLLLETAQRNNLKQEDLPSNVLICSDMAFDQGTSWNGCGSYWGGSSTYSAKKNALFESIKKKWADAGYKLPRLVYWNIASGAKSGVPLQENDLGVALVSGYSPAIANMVFSAKLDPYEVLLDAINVERYKPVEDAYNAAEK